MKLRPSISALALVIVALTAGIAGTARAFTLSTRIDYPTAAGPFNVTVADVNNDGRPDVIVPCFTANAVSVLLTTGGGHLLGHVDYPTGAGPSSAVVGDLNGDGRPDLVVTNQSANTVSVFLGNGIGGFGPRTDFSVGNLPSGAVIADFNEDGRLDVAVSFESGSGVTLLLGDGSGALGHRKDFTSGSISTALTCADFDGDGHMDLAVANHVSNTVAILHGDGAGGFSSPALLAVTNPTGVATADFNGDGIPDLVASSNITDSLTVWLGPVGSGPRTAYGIGSSLGYVTTGFLHSMTGSPDIVVADPGLATVAVLNGDGIGNFFPPAMNAVGFGVDAVAVTDLNGDGLMDIVSANNSANTVSVLLNNNGLPFSPRVEFADGGVAGGVALADMNHDGKLDAVVSGGAVEVLLGDGAGGLTAGPAHFGTSDGLAFADFNGDGNLDVATAEATQPPNLNLVGILTNNGAGGLGVGGLAARREYATGTDPIGVVAADFDGDGWPDLVTVNNVGNGISFLRNDQTGAFGGGHTDYAAGSAPISIASGDLNGDGIPDVAVTNSGSNNVSIFLGTGNGNFSPQVLVPTASSPWALAIGDLNGDGKPDLVVTSYNASTASVLINSGNGTTFARTDYSTGATPVGVAISDLDGDGVPDIVVCDQTGAALSILIGKGGGTFAGPLSAGVAPFPGGIAIGDLNGDGKPDLVFTEGGPIKLAVMLALETTRTTLSVSPNPVLLSGPLVLTASVTVPAPGSGSPTGLVYFFDGTTPLGSAPVTGGIAALNTTATRLGARSLWALYRGDSRFQASESATLPLRVSSTAAARIVSTKDVPADQGRSVRLDFSPSAFDFLGSPTPIARYDVFRRQLVIGASLAPVWPPGLRASVAPRAPAATRLARPDQTELAGWDFVASVPANDESEYDLVAPTVVDSNGTGFHWSVFMVRASTSTPGVYYDSPPDSGYSVDNLPPAPPAPFLGAYSGGATHLHWGANTEADFWYYKLYRGASSGFVPGPGNFVASLADTGYQDVGPAGSWYKLAAVDVNGNVSPFSTVGPNGITAVEDVGPAEFALAAPSPNPTRGPGLIVRFSLPAASPGRIELLDVTGRRVASREVGAFGPGAHSIDLAEGRSLPPGLYLVRLISGDRSRMVRAAVLE